MQFKGVAAKTFLFSPKSRQYWKLDADPGKMEISIWDYRAISTKRKGKCSSLAAGPVYRPQTPKVRALFSHKLQSALFFFFDPLFPSPDFLLGFFGFKNAFAAAFPAEEGRESVECFQECGKGGNKATVVESQKTHIPKA